MIKRFFSALILLLGFTESVYADEGMWLMQQLAKQYPKMQERGLKLKEYDLYNEQGTSLRDAVVIFGAGCTGEVISSQGLVLTNHHCGYDAIQGLSSVEKNYLEQGYWAQSNAEELPAKGLTITFIDKIEDVTDFVKTRLKKSKPGSMDYLSPRYLASLAKERVPQTAKGTEVEIKAFYNGNRYLMFTKKIYRDIRFVAAPPSSIGKFGADTDNWEYPRHTGDFSIFRIYADAEGNPAEYSPTNKPLRPKRWFNISTRGIEEGQFAMVMGFPGRTYRFFLPEEVEEWKDIDNDIRIRMRAIRQEAMLGEMLRDPKINIQYAAKYAYSQNGYKRAIGANWGIGVRRLGDNKAAQLSSLLEWAKPKARKGYESAVDTIREAIKRRADLRRRQWYLQEGFVYGLEFINLPALLGQGRNAADDFYKDYNAEVDKKVSKALLAEYLRQLKSEERPEALNKMLESFGSSDALIDAIFLSNYTTPEGLEKLKAQQAAAKAKGEERSYEGVQLGTKVIAPDKLLEQFSSMVRSEFARLNKEVSADNNQIDNARRTYVSGLIEQHGWESLWPDANSTLRFTYGNIKGYHPRDGVYYSPQTYLDGVIAKADSTSWEFAVPDRLKEIYEKQSYGKGNRWAEKTKTGEWRMPVNFCATTHTTGGNSGSPVIDGEGNLIGINFDRNWEGVGGDIQYLPDYQRSIICDIRYIMMLIEEYGKCPRLIDEMSLSK